MDGDESKSLALRENSQISPEISVIFAENIEGFQQRVKEVLKAIEQDESFSEMTAENYGQKKSYLTTNLEELSRMHRLLADQHAHLLGEVRKNCPSLIKKLYPGSSDSSSLQVAQMLKPNQGSNTGFFWEPCDYVVRFTSDPSGFDVVKKEGLSNSSSEASTSINKLPVPAVNDDAALKVKETNPPEDLSDKISKLEEEVVSLNKNLQSLRDENTELKQEIEENVLDISLYMSDSKHKIKTMEEELKKSKEQNKKINCFMAGILQEKAADKARLDGQIEELNKKIGQYVTVISELNRKHEARENIRNAVIKTLQDELQQKSESVEGMQETLDALLADKCSQYNKIQELQTRVNALQFENVGVLPSFDNVEKLTNELKLKVVELEREVDKQREVMSDST